MAERTRYPTLDNVVGFMPKGRLEIPGRPELQVFPSNLIITMTGQRDESLVFAAAIYLPDLTTLEEEEARRRLQYPNMYHPRYSLRIEHDNASGIYTGTKFDEERIIGFTESGNYEEFVMNIQQFGIDPQEGFQKIKSIPLQI